MVATSKDEMKTEEAVSSYDRMSEIKAFDETKRGVQGLVENGVTKIPNIFYCGPQHHPYDGNSASEPNPRATIPTIDLTAIHGGDPVRRDGVAREVGRACEEWGFFQVTNHGIPTHVLDEMIRGTCRFHQQDPNVRKEYYSRDPTKKVFYLSNFSLYKDPAADWRDTLGCFMAPHPPNAQELPLVCRDIMMEYSEKVKALASILFELLSEALGLNPSHLNNEMGCAEGLLLLCHCYPPCPEPELTIGSCKHTDRDFMTILLQDQIGGLQVLHHNQWIDVPPLHGALVVNIGDLLQLVTNDKFVSVQHRVLANSVGPRISVASLFRPPAVQGGDGTSEVVCGPMKELLSEENPPLYRDTTFKDYLTNTYEKGLRTSSIVHLKL